MEKINIAELLKDCPKGMKLYSPIFGEVFLKRVKDIGNKILIEVYTVCNSIKHFYPDGKYNTYYSDGECLLFPSKDQRDWSKFQRPFKDGDIIFTHANCLKVGLGNTWISIYQEKRNGGVATYVDCAEDGSDFYSNIDDDKPFLCMEKDIMRQRFASEEEKEKLFKAIKDNGYKWNPESKTLEKLVNPNFKVGDRIKHKASSKISKIIDIRDDSYITGNVTGNVTVSSIPFNVAESDFELITKFDINTLIPFESRVLVRDDSDECWNPAIWAFKKVNKDDIYPFVVVGGNDFVCCIPYDDNKHLIGKTDSCDEFYKTWE